MDMVKKDVFSTLEICLFLFISVDYRAALREFTLVRTCSSLLHDPLPPRPPPSSEPHWSAQVSGKIPIPPRYAFGIFYSRYWAYDDIGDMVCMYNYTRILLCSVEY